MWLSITVAIAAGAVGLGVAVWLVSGRCRWRALVRRIYFAPLLIPPYIYGLTWLSLLSRQGVLNRLLLAVFGVTVSPYGIFPTTAILTLAFVPIVTLMVLNALEAVEPELVEAAQVLAEARQVWTMIVLPLCYPALLGGMGLVFALTMVDYGVPALMQFNVYSMEIMAEFSQSGDPVQAMALAVPVLVPAMLLVAVSQQGWARHPLRPRPAGHLGLADVPTPAPLRVGSWIAVAAIAAGTLVPIFTILAQSGWGLAAVRSAGTAGQELTLSLGLALITAILSTAIALPSARLLANRRPGWLWALFTLPLAIPAPLFGVGMIHLWNRPAGAAVYGGPGMLVLAHVGRTLPLAVIVLTVYLRGVDPLLHDAARLFPVGWARRAIRVHGPLLAPGLLASAAIVFVLSLGELGTSLLVVPAGSATASLRLFNLLHYGANESVFGLALLILILVAAGGGGTLALARRRLR